MNEMDRKTHWETVYRTKAPTQVSWFQARAALSLELIQTVVPMTAAVLDVGGGASPLVDGLWAAGYRNLTVLDLSATALQHAQSRLAPYETTIRWIEGDVLTIQLPPASVDCWHDRAVFHFLVESADRARYLAQVKRAVKPGGYVLVATFAADGPTQCSGLPVARYSEKQLHDQFGNDFRLMVSRHEEHRTPGGSFQAFTYCLCRYEPQADLPPAAG